MKFRTVTLALCAALTAGAAWALEGNPISGVGVSVETDPGGIRAAEGATSETGNFVWQRPQPGAYAISISGASAVAACARVMEALPPEEQRRKGRGIAVGRGGGGYSRVVDPAAGGYDGPGVVVSLTNASGATVAAQWAACDALLTGRADARATLAPITLDRTQAAGPLTIGVGFVAGGPSQATPPRR